MKAFFKWSIGITGLLVLLAVALVILATNGGLLRHGLKRYGVVVMRERFNADVQLANLNIALFPGARIEGTGLVIWLRGRNDLPPLLTVRRFSLYGDFLSAIRKSRHFRTLILEGMRVQLPPRRTNARPAEQQAAQRTDSARRGDLRFTIDEIRSDDAELDMLRPEGKPALEFLLHHLDLHGVQPDGPMAFQASLTNPKPIGEIDTH